LIAYEKESVLRQTTIMFAAISGFTALLEKMKPEEVVIHAVFLKFKC